jgi:glycosyltransferase involved in cell wall biosynthesis
MKKIAVYSIARNEEKFAQRWADTVKDADYALVADTGSTDNTVDILQRNIVKVVPINVAPWRFDDARNTALSLLPSDIDVVIALDLDEVLTPGWRDAIEQCWTESTTRLRYQYVWSWTPEANPDLVYFADKISARFTHRWKAPVHEVLTATVPETITTCHDVLIEHHPDATKSRSQYLALLKLAVTEDPYDDRNSHYFGREYFYHGMMRQAIDELHRHLALPRATWKAERAASMRYIAKCHESLGETQLANEWYIRATLEEPSSREALIDAARYSLSQKAFYSTIASCQQAIALPVVNGDYMAERYARCEGAFDLMAVACWHVGQRDSAISYAEQAISLNPHDPRLMQNLRMIQSA